MSDSLSFDGTNLSTYGVSLVDSPIPIFAPPKIQTANIPQAHGVAVSAVQTDHPPALGLGVGDQLRTVGHAAT